MKNTQTAIVPGSLSDVMRISGNDLAESFVNVDAVILVDVSGSMSAHDSRGGKSRYDVALEELARLQATMPGKLGIVAFSSSVVFVPGGQPPFMGSGTDLASALKFVKVADVPDMRFILISDGQPDDGHDALAVAATFHNRIDTIFVGYEGDRLSQGFLNQLASISGGQAVTADRVVNLADRTTELLTAN